MQSKFNIGSAITVPLNMPGGRNFLTRLLLWGSALLLFSYFFFGRSIVSAYVSMFQKVIELEASGNEDPAVIVEAIAPLFSAMGSLFLLSIIAWVIMACIETAMHKNIFRGTDHGVIPLRLGKDELRVMLAQFVVYLICMGVYFAAYFALIFIVLLGAGLAQAAGGIGAALAGIIGILGIFGFFGAILYALARLAPAAAMSVRDNDIRTVEGWKLTKGRIGPVIGSYIIVFIVGYVCLMIISTIGFGLIFASGDLGSLFGELGGSSNPEEIWTKIGAAFKTPRVMIPLVITLMLTTVFMLVWYMCYWGVANYIVQMDDSVSNSD